MIPVSFLALEDAPILVTGASSGIGRAIAIAASEQGARIALVARDRARLEATMEAMPGAGHVIVEQDMSDQDGIPRAVQEASQVLGGLRGLVHAAGIHNATPLRGLSSETVREVLDVNVVSAFALIRAFRHRQVRQPGASVVLLSSAVGLVGQPGVSAYSTSKGALISLARSLALELVREDVRVNAVCPGVVRTEMTQKLGATLGEEGFGKVEAAHPLGLGDPRDVANAALFLLSGASKWITGTALSVDGGYTAQ